MKFYKVGFFTLLLIIVAAAAFYFGSYSKNKQGTPIKEDIFTKNEVPKKSSGEAMMEEDDSTSVTATPIALNYAKENIKDAISSKNTAALDGYMADSVNVILEASSCCGPLNKIDTIKQLEYLKDAQSPWNFDQTDETIKKLKEAEPTKYGPSDSYIGIASNEYTIAFKFNNENKINAITMAATYKLVLP